MSLSRSESRMGIFDPRKLDTRQVLPVSFQGKILDYCQEALHQYPQRLVEVPFGLPGRFNALGEGRVWIDHDQVTKARDKERLLKRPLAFSELVRFSLENGEHCVRPSFTSDALNDLNRLAYGLLNAQYRSFLTIKQDVNRALGRMLTRYDFGENLRVKELAASLFATERWATIHELSVFGQLDITLTDAVFLGQSASETVENTTITVERYDLLDELPCVADKDRYDIFIATLAFDSVWFPEDVFLQRVGGKWYQHFYRLRIPSAHPNYVNLLHALKTGDISGVKREDLMDVGIETVLQPTSLSRVPYGDVVEHNHVFEPMASSIPGGLVRRVVNAFENQISPQGIFIIGDLSVDDSQGTMYRTETTWKISIDDMSGNKSHVTTNKTQSAAAYATDCARVPIDATQSTGAVSKVLDMYIAKTILEKMGYQVKIITVKDLLDTYGEKSAGDHHLEIRHKFMLIQRQ